MKTQGLSVLMMVGLIVMVCGVCQAETDVTVYALEDYPPYTYVDSGTLKGIYVDILQRVFSQMHRYRVTMLPIPWKRGLAYLEKGTGFALFPPYYLPKERPYMDYSTPIFPEEVILMCPEALLITPRPNWPDDYYGLKIGNNAGYHIGGEAFDLAGQQGKLIIEEAKTTHQNLQKLINGRVDCYLNDRMNIRWELAQLKRDKLYDEGGKHSRLKEGVIVKKFDVYLGITNRDRGKFSFKEDFVKQFNQIIEEMKASGEIQKIVEAFFFNAEERE